MRRFAPAGPATGFRHARRRHRTRSRHDTAIDRLIGEVVDQEQALLSSRLTRAQVSERWYTRLTLLILAIWRRRRGARLRDSSRAGRGRPAGDRRTLVAAIVDAAPFGIQISTRTATWSERTTRSGPSSPVRPEERWRLNILDDPDAVASGEAQLFRRASEGNVVNAPDVTLDAGAGAERGPTHGCSNG